ncbi:MAG: hypothetical protein WBE26_14810, partial [Phycisphaerae bacterium]
MRIDSVLDMLARRKRGLYFHKPGHNPPGGGGPPTLPPPFRPPNAFGGPASAYHHRPTISQVYPPSRDGLTFYAPFTRDHGTVPIWSAAGSTGLSTETVDEYGTYTDAYSNLIVGATSNTARVGADGMVSEVARENLCLHFSDYADAWWNNALAMTATANDATAPNGAEEATR